MINLREQYWVVEVPFDAKNFRFGKSQRIKNKLFYSTTLDYFAGAQVVEFPPGTWQIVCTSKEVTKEQAAQIVDSSQWYFPVKHTRYVDYAFPFDREFKQRWSEGFGTAIESLRSLLASKGCDLKKTYLILKKTL